MDKDRFTLSSTGSLGSLEESLIEYSLGLWRSSWKNDCDLAGVMNKLAKGTVYRRWQKRWFVLKNDTLFYFKKKDEDSPNGVLFLDSKAKIERVSGMEPLCIALTVNSSCSIESRKAYEQRVYHFSFSNALELERWVCAIKRACGQDLPNEPVPLAAAATFPRGRRKASIVSLDSNTASVGSEHTHIRTSTHNTDSLESLSTKGRSEVGSYTTASTSFARSASQSLYSIYMNAKVSVEECVQLIQLYLGGSPDAPAVNYVEPVTIVIKHVRQLLYLIDSTSRKGMENPDLAGFISRQMSLIIDRCRVIGFQAKHLTEEECIGFKRPPLCRELSNQLEALLRELHVFVSISKNLSTIDKVLQNCDELTKEASPILATCILDVLHHVLSSSTFLLAMNVSSSIASLKRICDFSRDLSDLFDATINPADMSKAASHLAILHAKSKVALDRKQWAQISSSLVDMVFGVEHVLEELDIWSNSDSMLTVSENFFALAALLLRLLISLSQLEPLFPDSSTLHSLIQGIKPMETDIPDTKLAIDTSSASNAISPPSPVHPILEGLTPYLNEKFEQPKIERKMLNPDVLAETMTNKSEDRSSLFGMESHRSSFARKSRVLSEATEYASNRNLFDLIKIAQKNARQLKQLLSDRNALHSASLTDRISQYSVAMVTAASQTNAELLAENSNDTQLEDCRVALERVSMALETSLKNWMAMISPQTQTRKMVETVILFEKQCEKLSKIAEQTEKYRASKQQTRPPTPPDTQEQRDEDEEVKQLAGEIEEILLSEDQEYRSSVDIQFREDGRQVKGGTVELLVQQLTYYKLPSPDFTSAFLLTYRSFTNDKDLLQLLIKRYNIEPPSELEERQRSIYFAKKILPIRLRVFNVLKMWVKENFQEIKADQELLDSLYEFLPTLRADFLKGTTDFQSFLDRQISSQKQRGSTDNLSKAPMPILPKSLDYLDILSLDPLELARQVSLIQMEIFQRIQPKECLNQAWNRKELHHLSPNIREMIQFSNFIVHWVSTEIVSNSNVRSRALVIKHFILVADKLRSLNNFDGLKSVLCGLQASGVRRLKQSWDLVPAKFHLIMDDLASLMSEEKSCKRYRQTLHSINPPCIPFLGIYLTDLTMIETGNPDMLRDLAHLINFHKRYLIAQVIQDITGFQNSAYSLVKVNEICDWIRTREIKDAQEVYELSLEYEPRVQQVQTVEEGLQRRLSSGSKRSGVALSFASFRSAG